MSYDILIFEPGVVTDEDFPQWWDRVSRWEEPHDYDSIERATPAIRSFYRDLVRTFPPFNGPDALSDDEVDARLAQGLPVADYTIGEDLVYVGVSWSAADALVVTAGELAWTHRLLTRDALVGFRWFGVSFRWYCGVGGLVVGH